MAWFAGQSLVALILSFLLGLFVGWLIWALRKEPSNSDELASMKADLESAQKELVTTQKQRDDCRALTMTGPRHLADFPEMPELDPSVVDTKSRKELNAVALVSDVDETEWDAELEDLQTTSVSTARAEVEDEDLPSEPEAPTEEPIEPEETDTGEEPEAIDLEPEAANADAEDAPDPEPAVETNVEPAAFAAPKADDKIERIEGIGPKIGGALRAAGLGTFIAIADTDEATLREAIEAGGIRFAPSITTWSKQARLLADGDEAGFKTLTDNLTAGRDKG